jgi:ATP-dependent protease ClpP protease subunit
VQYADREKPVSIYFNCEGSQQDMQAIGFDEEAYAILDTMNVRCCDCWALVIVLQVHTSHLVPFVALLVDSDASTHHALQF